MTTPNIQAQFDGGVLSYNERTHLIIKLNAFATNTEFAEAVGKGHVASHRALNKLSAVCIEFSKAKRKGEV